MGMRFLFSFILCFLTCATGLAKVELEATKPLLIPVDNVTPKLTSDDVAKIVPTDPTVSNCSTSTMMTRIADRSFNAWFNSPTVKESMMGRIAQETQEKLKTDVVVPSRSVLGTTHKFSFKIEAFQALAKMEYTGWMRAAVNYDAKAASTDFFVKEKVFTNKELILSHQAKKEQGLSMIALAWQW